MKIKFQEFRFRSSTLAVISQANEILDDYTRQGFILTLRQLYYQFVSRALIENSVASYKKLSTIINDARLAGLIDWQTIEDRGRNLVTFSAWETPQDILYSAAESFRSNPWINQPYYIEIWVEKDALTGVIEVPASKWRVPHFACKGYTSQSEMFQAGYYRFREKRHKGKQILVIHLGDHDPSGIDMTRDMEDRLQLFSGRRVEVLRIALNMDQVDEFNPPPNPAKITDTRFESYAAKYGDESWELDALEPNVINSIVLAEVEKRIDLDQWNEDMEEEEENRQKLRQIAEDFSDR